MFAKLLIVCVVAAAALAIEYPPGVNPLLCPDYPFCREGLLARYAIDGFPITRMGMPFPYFIRALPVPAVSTTAAPVVADVEMKAAKYPADFDPALCPNYPYCN